MTTLSFPSYFSNLTLQPDSDSDPDPDSLSQPQSDNTTTETCPTPGSGMTRDTALHHVSFNQDHTCFTVGTTQGFRVYDCDPVQEMFRRDIDNTRGGIGFVEMLFRSQILAIVPRGPHAPPTKVLMWDDHSSRCFGELSFRSDVKSVRLRQDRIVVVLAHKVFVYDYVCFKLLHQIETAPNPSGLCEVSQGVGPNMVLVCPGLQTGQVRVDHYVSKRTRFIHAHDSKLACLGLTQDGRFFATASSRGTLVRVFNAFDGSLIQEVRRGAEQAEIHSIAFSSTAQWLAVSSDKGTVHVFGLKIDSGALGTDRSRGASEPSVSKLSAISSLSFFKGVLPRYFSSEWSMAQFRLQEGLRSIVAFGHQKNTVMILGMDGSFYRCKFDPVHGGEMTQLEYYNFLKPEESS